MGAVHQLPIRLERNDQRFGARVGWHHRSDRTRWIGTPDHCPNWRTESNHFGHVGFRSGVPWLRTGSCGLDDFGGDRFWCVGWDHRTSGTKLGRIPSRFVRARQSSGSIDFANEPDQHLRSYFLHDGAVQLFHIRPRRFFSTRSTIDRWFNVYLYRDAGCGFRVP